MKKLFFVSILFLLAIGCGPRYQTFTTYTPPAGPEGRACVAQCHNTKMMCEKACESEYRNCRFEAKEEAQRRYQNALDNYWDEIRDWERRMRDCERNNPPGACDNLYEKKPARPESDDYERFHHCQKQCPECLDDYEMCFQMCGGAIHRETHCVANCP